MSGMDSYARTMAHALEKCLDKVIFNAMLESLKDQRLRRLVDLSMSYVQIDALRKDASEMYVVRPLIWNEIEKLMAELNESLRAPAKPVERTSQRYFDFIDAAGSHHRVCTECAVFITEGGACNGMHEVEN